MTQRTSFQLIQTDEIQLEDNRTTYFPYSLSTSTWKKSFSNDRYYDKTSCKEII